MVRFKIVNLGEWIPLTSLHADKIDISYHVASINLKWRNLDRNINKYGVIWKKKNKDDMLALQQTLIWTLTSLFCLEWKKSFKLPDYHLNK